MSLDIKYENMGLYLGGKLSEKYIAMTSEERQQFLFGEFKAKQESQPVWVGVDYSEKKDQTIKFQNTGFSIEII